MTRSTCDGDVVAREGQQWAFPFLKLERGGTLESDLADVSYSTYVEIQARLR